MTKKPHLGKNLSRIRVTRNMKQETLARALGISQQAVSKMEQRAVIGDDSLKKIAKILVVPLATLKDCDEDFIIDKIINCEKRRYSFRQSVRLIIWLIKKLFKGNR